MSFRASRTFVSPGVFANEVDVSFLGAEVEAIGAALIGTAPQGPAFVPIRVTTKEEFRTFFGNLDTDHFLTYAAEAYLTNAPVANIVRVLGPEGRTANGANVEPGYTAEKTYAIVETVTETVMALVDVTASAHLVVVDEAEDLFNLSISGTDGEHFTGSVSFLESSGDLFIENALNSDPTRFLTDGYFLRTNFNYAVEQLSNGSGTYSSSSLASMNDYTIGYQQATGPWVKSQNFAGSTFNLFRIHTLGDGQAENGRFKYSISNVKVSPNTDVTKFGTFDLEVREFADTDTNPVIVQSFVGLDLDPTSRNYIAKRR